MINQTIKMGIRQNILLITVFLFCFGCSEQKAISGPETAPLFIDNIAVSVTEDNNSYSELQNTKIIVSNEIESSMKRLGFHVTETNTAHYQLSLKYKLEPNPVFYFYLDNEPKLKYPNVELYFSYNISKNNSSSIVLERNNISCSQSGVFLKVTPSSNIPNILFNKTLSECISATEADIGINYICSNITSLSPAQKSALLIDVLNNVPFYYSDAIIKEIKDGAVNCIKSIPNDLAIKTIRQLWDRAQHKPNKTNIENDIFIIDYLATRSGLLKKSVQQNELEHFFGKPTRTMIKNNIIRWYYDYEPAPSNSFLSIYFEFDKDGHYIGYNGENYFPAPPPAPPQHHENN